MSLEYNGNPLKIMSLKLDSVQNLTERVDSFWTLSLETMKNERVKIKLSVSDTGKNLGFDTSDYGKGTF